MMKKELYISEDWTSCIIGLVMILLTAATTFFPELPQFGPKTGWSGWTVLSAEVFTSGNSLRLALTFIYFLFFASAGSLMMGKDIRSLLISFPVIFVFSMAAQFIASSGSVKNLGLETVLFSLIIGLYISNVTGVPAWLRQGIQSEFYIKTGLVMLGATILFSEILKAGFLGMIQAMVGVFSVWYFAFWIAKKFRVDDELGMMLASAVSICGVSAAIATAGAIKGDSKKLSYVISLVLIVAIPMMIIMPVIAKWMGLSGEVTGAWLGGTIDTTGAVVASGTIAGETALKFSTIIKFSQNVLLGVAAFLISVYWSYRMTGRDENSKNTGLGVIWKRFPKFVLGFITASLVFSFLVSPEAARTSGIVIKSYQSLWFNLAFICIGMETRFTELVKIDKGKPILAFLIAQVFNIIITLVIAYVLFGALWKP